MFSQEEISFVKNSDFILTKNAIIQKVMLLFGRLADHYRVIAEEKKKQLPIETLLFSPKIARGEQYQGLPYVMLDYPRIFSKEDVFAARTFFWWGNYFSITLHLKGKYKNQFEKLIEEKLGVLSEKNFFIGISKDEWSHDFKVANYEKLKTDKSWFENRVRENEFLKLAASWPLQVSNDIERLLVEEFMVLMKVVAG